MSLNNIGLFGLIQKGGKREFVAVKGHTNNSGGWPGAVSKKEWAEIRIEASDRYDALDLVIDILEGAGYKWSKYDASTSSFDAIQVDAGPLKKTKKGNYDATGPKEQGARIIFKFPNNKDAKDFDIWNEALEQVFKSHPKLKKVMSDRNELNVAKIINKKLGLFIKGGGTLKLGTISYANVAGVVGGSGHQDFRVIDMDGNVVTSISYKAGNKATDFQQYSGISERSSIGGNEEVVAFRNSVVDNWDSYKKQGFNAMWRDIDKDDLKEAAVFGNAEWFAQGTPSVTKNGTGAKLNFRKLETKITKMTNGYTPTLGARGGEGSRRIVGKSKALTGVRGGVYTKNYLHKGRKAKDV
tara:strand:- start:18 stop:1079 length:1062 start_codon:yes stop_codon:yes gene_type:complete